MTLEHGHQSVRFMICLTLGVDLSICMAEESQYIHGSISDIFKRFQALHHAVGSSVWCQSFQDLNTRTFIKKEVIPRWIVE
jgi:hypothetical protein